MDLIDKYKVDTLFVSDDPGIRKLTIVDTDNASKFLLPYLDESNFEYIQNNVWVAVINILDKITDVGLDFVLRSKRLNPREQHHLREVWLFIGGYSTRPVFVTLSKKDI